MVLLPMARVYVCCMSHSTSTYHILSSWNLSTVCIPAQTVYCLYVYVYSVNACDVIVAALSFSEFIDMNISSVTWSDAQFLCYSEPFIFNSINVFRNKCLGRFLQGGPKTENTSVIVNTSMIVFETLFMLLMIVGIVAWNSWLQTMADTLNILFYNFWQFFGHISGANKQRTVYNKQNDVFSRFGPPCIMCCVVRTWINTTGATPALEAVTPTGL